MRRHYVYTASFAVLGAILAASPAVAQQAAPAPEAATPPTAIEEVVVTAQKRSENIQGVPIAITAFTAKGLQERGIGSVSQLADVTPNVTLDAGTPFSGSSAVLAAFIRGIGSDDFAFNIDPGVGVYVDGVYLARTVGANQDLLDVQRIEILKGPQGTLFGRNTIGGAVSIVTRDPGDTFKVVGDVTTGSYNLIQARGSADIPIAEGLNSSLTFSVKRQDGYLKRIPFPGASAGSFGPGSTAFNAAGYGTSSTEGSADNWSLRGKLKYDRGGPLKVTLTGDYTENRDTSATSLVAVAPNVPGNFAGTTNLPGTAFDPTGLTGFNFAGLYNFCVTASAGQIAARNAQALCGVRGTQFRPNLELPGLAGSGATPFDGRFLTGDIDKSYATGNDFSRLKSGGVALQADYQVNKNLTVRSITAYRGLDWTTGLDADGSPLAIAELSFTMDQQQFSQEVQLLGSAFGKTLNYVAGAYYFEESGHLHDFVTFGEGAVQVDGPNSLSTQNGALFGQVDWRPIDLIGFTVGGRFTDEYKTFTGGQQDLNGFNYKLFGCADANGNIRPNGAFPLAPVTCQQALSYPNPANPIQLYAPGKNKRSFSNFSPKLGVQLHPASQILAYASYSEGYKTGGWTTRLTNPLPDAQPFDPETASTWEVGIKSQLLDRRLQFNVAAFTTDYQNIQLNFQQGTSPTIRNAGNARINGFEIETIASLAHGLTLNTSLGYLNAYYTSVLPGVLAVSAPNIFQAGTQSGASLPKTPHVKLNIGPRYQFDFGNGASLVAIAGYTYTSSSWTDAQRTFLLQRAASNTLNTSISYTEPKQLWNLTVGVTNLLDDRYLTSGGSNIADGVFFGTYNQPREGYVRFGVKF